MEGLIEISQHDVEVEEARPHSSHAPEDAPSDEIRALRLQERLEAEWKAVKPELDASVSGAELRNDWSNVLCGIAQEILRLPSNSGFNRALKARAACYCLAVESPTDQTFIDGLGVYSCIEMQLIQSILVGIMESRTDPDAALLELGKKFEAELDRTEAFRRTAEGLGIELDENACASLSDAVWAVANPIFDARAYTIEGMRVKARAIAWRQSDRDLRVDDFANLDEAKSMLKDLLMPADLARVSRYWAA